MQPPVYGAAGQEAGNYVSNLSNNAIHFTSGTHSQPSTPTIGM